jgi:transposase
VAMLALPLPVVCAPTPSRARFGSPPWDRSSPDWLRLDAKLPADHLARRVARAVAGLDLGLLPTAYAGTGSLAHRPDLLLAVALFEVQRGRRSPAQWYLDLAENEPCQWLAFGLRPARSRLYAFRDRLGPLLDRLHEQLIGSAVADGLSRADQAALDGSAVAANASRHRLLNEATLAKREQALALAVAADQASAAPPAAPRTAAPAATPRGR